MKHPLSILLNPLLFQINYYSAGGRYRANITDHVRAHVSFIEQCNCFQQQIVLCEFSWSSWNRGGGITVIFASQANNCGKIRKDHHYPPFLPVNIYNYSNIWYSIFPFPVPLCEIISEQIMFNLAYIISDKWPDSKTDRLMHMHDRNNSLCQNYSWLI